MGRFLSWTSNVGRDISDPNIFSTSTYLRKLNIEPPESSAWIYTRTKIKVWCGQGNTCGIVHYLLETSLYPRLSEVSWITSSDFAKLWMFAISAIMVYITNTWYWWIRSIMHWCYAEFNMCLRRILILYRICRHLHLWVSHAERAHLWTTANLNISGLWREPVSLSFSNTRKGVFLPNNLQNCCSGTRYAGQGCHNSQSVSWYPNPSVRGRGKSVLSSSQLSTHQDSFKLVWTITLIFHYI